jgi:hypothetical protein
MKKQALLFYYFSIFIFLVSVNTLTSKSPKPTAVNRHFQQADGERTTEHVG